MRVLVCGGRNYNDQKRVFQELDALHKGAFRIELIIEGGAEGADRQGRFWALDKGLPCMTIHAAWHKLGKSAGHIRNGWMLKFGDPDLVVAFPGGRGTANMVETARAVGLSVREVE